MTFGKSAALDKNQYTADGYTFAGWSRDKNASVAEYKDGQNVNLDEYVKSDETLGNIVNLYAIWTPEIKAEDKTFEYDPKGYDVTKLFTIPEGLEDVTYTLKDNTTNAKLDDTNVLKVTATGTFTIEASIEASSGITAAKATAKITIEKAEGKGTLVIEDEKVTYVPVEIEMWCNKPRKESE